VPLEAVVVLLVLVLDDVVEEVEAVVSDDVVLVSDGVVIAGSSLVEKNVYVGPAVGAGAEGVVAGACWVCACDAGAGCALAGGVDARAEEGSVAREPVSSSTTGVDANGSAGVFGVAAAGAIWACLSVRTGTCTVRGLLTTWCAPVPG
jgi:hypothetical protein